MEMSKKEKPLTREDVQGMIDVALDDFAKRGQIRRMKDNDTSKSETPKSQKTMTLRGKIRAWFERKGDKDKPKPKKTLKDVSEAGWAEAERIRKIFSRGGTNDVPVFEPKIEKRGWF